MTVTVAAGTHTVTLSLVGYNDYTVTVDVPAGGSVSQVYTLTAFTCPDNTDTYSLDTASGATIGCVAFTDDWGYNPNFNNNWTGTVNTVYSLANSYCLRSADVKLGYDIGQVDQESSPAFDASSCMRSYTSTLYMDTGADPTLVDVSTVYITSSAIVQKQGSTNSIAISALDNTPAMFYL